MRVSLCCVAILVVAGAGCHKSETAPPQTTAAAQPAAPVAPLAPAAAPAPAATAAPVASPVPAGPPKPGDQDPARLAAAKDLLEAMRYRQTMMKMLEDQKGRLKMAIERNTMMLPMGSAKPAEIADLRKRMLDTWWSAIHPDELMAEFVKMYARIFSAEDLQTMAAFYRTHAGQALVDHTFDLPVQSGKIFNPQIQAAIPKMLKLQKDFMAAHPAKNPPRRGPILPPGLQYVPGAGPGSGTKTSSNAASPLAPRPRPSPPASSPPPTTPAAPPPGPNAAAPSSAPSST